MDNPTLILVFSRPADMEVVKKSFTFDVVISGTPCKRNIGQYTATYDCYKSEKGAECTHDNDRYCIKCTKVKYLQKYQSFGIGDPKKAPEAHIYFIQTCKATKNTLVEMRKWDPTALIIIPSDVLPTTKLLNIQRYDDTREYTRKILEFVDFSRIHSTVMQMAEIDLAGKIADVI